MEGAAAASGNLAAEGEASSAPSLAAAKVRLRFISVGCNRLVNAATWGRNNLLAYGAHNMIALYAPDVRRPWPPDRHPSRDECQF